jgi:hypothetical protein
MTIETKPEVPDDSKNLLYCCMKAIKMEINKKL